MLKVFKLLSKLKGLCGMFFDIFGYFFERKMECWLIVEYCEFIDSVIGNFNEDNIEIGIKIVVVVWEIGGYGLVKEELV